MIPTMRNAMENTGMALGVLMQVPAELTLLRSSQFDAAAAAALRDVRDGDDHDLHPDSEESGQAEGRADKKGEAALRDLQAILSAIGRCFEDWRTTAPSREVDSDDEDDNAENYRVYAEPTDDSSSKMSEQGRVVCSLLNAIVSCSSGTRRSKDVRLLSRVLRWLTLSWPNASVNALAFSALAANDVDRRTKLELVNFLRSLFSNNGSVVSAGVRDVRLACREVSPAVLLWVAAECSSLGSSSRFRRPTKLALAAGDLLMEVLLFSAAEVSRVTRQQEHDLKEDDSDTALRALWVQRSVASDYAELLIEWNKAAGLEQTTHMYLLGLTDLSETLTRLQSLKGFSRARALALAANLSSAGSAGLVSDDELVTGANNDEVALELERSAAELGHTPLGQELDPLDEDDRLWLLQLDEVARLQCRRVCLIAGKLSPVLYDSAMAIAAPALLRESAKQLQRRSGSNEGTTSRGMALAVRILSACLEAVLTIESSDEWDERVTGAYTPMLDMLKAHDSVARCCVDVIASGAANHPMELLPVLLGMLASKSSSVEEKVNVLAVFEKYVTSSAAEREKVADRVEDEPFREELLARVMDQVDSDSFVLREPAGAVLGAMEPSFVIPHLCHAIMEGADISAESRSVGVMSLVHCFERQVDTMAVFELFLTSTRGCDNERIMDTAPRWAAVIPEHLWPRIVGRLVREMFDAPGDPALVGLARRLRPWIEQGLATDGTLLQDIVITHMYEQPQLDEVLLAGDGSALQQLLFARLSPLLFLRMLSCEYFATLSFDDNNSVGQRIVTAMLFRMIATYEFKETRQMAAEALARLPPSATWPSLSFLLKSFLRSGNNDVPAPLGAALTALEAFDGNEMMFSADVTVAKTAVLGMCNALMAQPSAGITVDAVKALEEALALNAATETKEGMQSILQLQQGCTQCLSLLVMADSDAWRAEANAQRRADQRATAKVVDLDEQTADEAFEKVQQDVMQDETVVRSGPEGMRRTMAVLTNHAQPASARICASNALVLALRTAAQAASALPSNLQEKEHRNKQPIKVTTEQQLALDGFISARFVDSVANFIQSEFGRSNNNPHILASALQLLFTSGFLRIKLHSAADSSNDLPMSHSIVNKSFCITLAALAEDSELVRVAALKLAGMLLSLPNSVAIPDGALGRLISLLRGVANLDSNQEARHLAEELLKTLRQ